MAAGTVEVGARKAMLLGLVGVFLIQTWMVYTDPAGRADPPLSERAARGQALWHEHNCQSCHQLYGFGGFLGPDLTNASRSLADERLEAVLSEGTEVMPAFRLDAEERDALAAFFEELGQTGEGQARAAGIVPPAVLLEELVLASDSAEDPFSALESAGLALILERNCIDCHLPNAVSAYVAPDLCSAVERRGRGGLDAIFATGVSGKAMPRFPFTPEESDAVFAVLTRMGRHAEMLHAGFERAADATQGALADLPWFEYPPVLGR